VGGVERGRLVLRSVAGADRVVAAPGAAADAGRPEASPRPRGARDGRGRPSSRRGVAARDLAESRRTEILIGELLGPPLEHGGDRRSDGFESSADLIHPQHHAWFWQECVHADDVEALLGRRSGPNPGRQMAGATARVASAGLLRPRSRGDRRRRGVRRRSARCEAVSGRAS
jgi:hypothetical protein